MKYQRLTPPVALLLSLCLWLCGTVTATATTHEQGGTAMDITRDLRLSEEGTTYYISSSLGNDQNDGLSEETPWRSFIPLYRMDLGPGDRVLLRRGDLWRERLTVRANGREDAWVFVGAYGDPADPKPEISLSNGRDDIGILASDISYNGERGFGLNYVWIDNITVSHSLLGIYFRYDSSTDNRGVRVTNCSFSDINCPDLMEEAMTDVSFLTEKKGNLEDSDGGRITMDGGVAEYIWPTAINIGGRPPLPLADVEVPGKAAPSNAVSDIELYQNEFDGCVIAVGANCYNYHYGTGPNQCYTYTRNWRVEGLVTRNTMTAVSIDSADFGYDGTPDSLWGRWSHIQTLGGMEDCTMSFGTTQALLSCCRNLYISHSSFSHCRNNGQADGCGFDFERGVHNVTLDSCIFANNQGQGILVMQTTMENQVTGQQVTTPNTGNRITGCLFYNNMTSVLNSNYRYDITVFNPNNEDFTVTDNAFYFREKTAGGAEEYINLGNRREFLPHGPERGGFTVSGSTMVRNDTLPPLAEAIAAHGLEEATVIYPPVEKIWYHYTEEGAAEAETEDGPEVDTLPREPAHSAPAESGSPAATEPILVNTTPTEGGCGSAMSAALPVAAAVAAMGTAKLHRRRRSDI